MNRKRSNNNSLSITPMGLGLAALGRPGYINLGHGEDLKHNHDVAAMETQAHRVLDAAWQAGIRYFDAARSYGRAEDFLSSWLTERNIKEDAVTVASKWGYTYTADWQTTLPTEELHEVKDHSLPVLQRQILESRTLLGDHLDLYQIHSTTLDSGVLDNDEVLKKLAQMRNSGLAIGFSVSGSKQAEIIERALDIQFDGKPLFSAVQATWNILEQSAAKALQAAHAAGLTIIIKEGLANGRLTLRNDSPSFAEKLTLLSQQAAAANTTLDALALAAVLNQPFVDVVLSGAASVAHLQSNVKALTVDWNDELTSTLSNLQEPAEEYWQTRSQLTWN